MRLKHSINGGQDLQEAYRRLGDAASHDAALEALMIAAEPIRSMSAAGAPRSAGKGPHLADHIIVSETTRARRGGRWRDVRDGVTAIAIGPSYRPSDVFWGWFQEFGTAFMAAHPFMRPAWMQGRRLVAKSIAAHLWGSMLRRIGGGT